MEWDGWDGRGGVTLIHTTHTTARKGGKERKTKQKDGKKTKKSREAGKLLIMSDQGKNKSHKDIKRVWTGEEIDFVESHYYSSLVFSVGESLKSQSS